MEHPGLCDLCGRQANLFSCIACGKRVCSNCYNSMARICKAHAMTRAGASVRKFN